VNDKNILVLASNSPRRKQLLALGNWNFVVIVADIDEAVLEGETPKEYVIAWHRPKRWPFKDKANVRTSSSARIRQLSLTIPFSANPSMMKEAEKMLRQLRGRTHQVYTGIALLPRAGKGADLVHH
jgi:septum formation protein